MNISVKDAKELFEELIQRAEAGEHVIVTRRGKPVVELRALTETANGQSFGSLPRVGAFKDQKIWIAPDFDELGPEWDEYVK
jgi:antitoxin (DNA-binding transcriptional repressor) of toxin-antitoxin stability system